MGPLFRLSTRAGLALQLRVEPDGNGIMVINANTVLYLNETATAYAYFLMQGISEEAVLKKIRRMYRLDKKTAKKDYEKLVYTISTLARTEKVCPISFLDIKSVEPFSAQYSAPLRMDIALSHSNAKTTVSTVMQAGLMKPVNSVRNNGKKSSISSNKLACLF
jgi:hypothetical protein